MRFAATHLRLIRHAQIVATVLLALLGSSQVLAAPEKDSSLETAIFAGGCFWCVEADFDKVPGVTETVSGYIGGHVANPSYKQVSRGGTGHIESVQITFDPSVTTFERLVYLFWRSVDPTDAGGQFCDRGESYTTAIFVASEEQRQVAETSKKALEASGSLEHTVVTPIRAATEFWPAEMYHQNYYKRNKLRYKYYRNGCGRDKRVKALWGSEAWAAK